MGDKYYGHTISKVVDEIVIEPVARNSAEKSTVHPVYANDSIGDSITEEAENVIVTGKGTESDITTVAQSKNAQTAVELLTNSNLEADEGGIEANLARVASERYAEAQIKEVTDGNTVRGPQVNAEAGLVRDEYTQTLDAKEMDKIDAVAKALGVKVVFKDKVNFGKDDAAIQGSVIEIEKGTDRALEYLIGHEIMHRIRELSPQNFKNFANAVKVSRYSEYAAELETTERVYEEGEDIDEEAICNMAGKIALDNDLLMKFIEQNKHDKGILRTFRGVLKKIWNTFTGAEKKKINDAIYQLEKALNEGSKVAEHLTKEGKTENRDSIDFEGQKNNTDAGVKSLIKYPTFSESEIKENCIKLQKMKEVAFLSGNEFSDDGTPLASRVLAYFESLGNSVYSEQFGDIGLTKSSVRSERRHGNTNEKTISYAAIPNVIKNGVVIDAKPKNFGEVERIVVAAPIRIGKDKYYMGVMLQRDSANQRLYAHDVVIEKETAESETSILNTTGPLSETDNLFITDILQNALSVKKKSTQNNQENSSPSVKSSRKGADNFATERKQSKDRQVVFNELAQEQAKEIEAKLKETLGENADLRKQLKEANRKAEHFKEQLRKTPELAHSKNSQVTEMDVAELFILLEQYQAKGDYESAHRVTQELSEIGRRAGRTVQMFSILGRLTPEGMTMYVQRELDEVFEKITKYRSKEFTEKVRQQIELTEDDIEFIRLKVEQAAWLPEGRDKHIVLAQISSLIQEKIPSTVGDKINLLQRISLLLNHKTNIRNVLGNAIVTPMDIASNFIASPIDALLSKTTV